MTPIPPDAKRVVLAAVVPCKKYGVGDCLRLRYYGACDGCNADGTRTVVTDIEVEAREVVVPGAPTETWWRPT